MVQSYVFVVTGANQTTASVSYPVTFDISGILHIPVVYVGGYYYNVYLQLYSADPQIIFAIYDVYELTSGGVSSGSDDNSSGGDYYGSGYDPNKATGGYDADGNYGYNNPYGDNYSYDD